MARRTLAEIIANQDEIARRFEEYEPKPEDFLDPAPFGALMDAAEARSKAESDVLEAVVAARTARYPWSLIGGLLGTSAQAAQQRYGALVRERQRK